MDDWMHGWVNVCVGWLLVVAWAYGRLIHARGLCLQAYGLYATPEDQQVYYQQTHTFMQPCIESSIYPTIRPYTHPHIHLSTHSFTNPSVHPPRYPPTYSFNQPPIHPLSIHPSTWMHGRVDERMGE